MNRTPLPVPPYVPSNRTMKLLLGMESFRRHMTSETWQLQLGLQAAGYTLCGRGLTVDTTDCRELAALKPAVAVIMDKREWDPQKPGCFDKQAEFKHVDALTQDPEVFRLTVLKDAHQDPDYHREASRQLNVHAWIVYYNAETVFRLCPWLRLSHLLRTLHSVASEEIPLFEDARNPAIVSGALGRGVYDFRQRIHGASRRGELGEVDSTCGSHPGYHARGCHTPVYLQILNRYKVSICTASVYGYALRKLMESLACGCRVITDLAGDDGILPCPGVRTVPRTISMADLRRVIAAEIERWNPVEQRCLAHQAQLAFDYRTLCADLSRQINCLRSTWEAS